MANPVSPLDFESIISYALGDVNIFIYVALIAFSILAAKVRMPMNAYLMLMFVFGLIMFFTVSWSVMIIAGIMIAAWIALMWVKRIR